MGYEYKIKTQPNLTNIDQVSSVLEDSPQWQKIKSGFSDIESAIGIATVDTINSDWPQVADFCMESDGSIFICCHNHEGGDFLNHLVKRLKTNGYTVEIDDDI